MLNFRGVNECLLFPEMCPVSATWSVFLLTLPRKSKTIKRVVPWNCWLWTLPIKQCRLYWKKHSINSQHRLLRDFSGGSSPSLNSSKTNRSYPLRLQVCPQEGTTPVHSYSKDGIGTQNFQFDQEGPGFFGIHQLLTNSKYLCNLL